jgi:hypothetical protein
MDQTIFGNRKFLYVLLILQVIPLLLFPPSIFKPTSQTWWLPALLVIFALVGTIQIFRKSRVPWSLYLVSFAHGFNIISRLMMLLPQSTSGTSTDVMYFIFSLIALAGSALMLWIMELPRVRQVLVG